MQTHIFNIKRWCAAALGVVLLLGVAACGDGEGPGPITQTQPEPPLGATSFVSAAGGAGQRTDLNDWAEGGADGAPAADGTDGGRLVQEGDIFRMLDRDTILNLNMFRGLQVVDVSDADAPRVIGALRVPGTPVELYVEDGFAVVLLNSWYGYQGSQAEVERFEGGVILSVDLSDPTQPVVVDREAIAGDIVVSRLTTSASGDALYVAAASRFVEDGGAVVDPEVSVGTVSPEGARPTLVSSYTLSDGALEPRTMLDLGGFITDIQATPEALLVARYDASTGSGGSLVSIIDISDPGGAMVLGGEVEVEGMVQSQFNMDLYRGVLRVVSARGWADEVSHVETFDASDLQALTPIDHASFGEGEDLYATLFMGNRAFFVTYRRVDPFHAFFIDDEGAITEMSEFVVSGWNDFFKPVALGTRLLGVGIDDQEGWRLAVSLYDITDLANPSPLLAREASALEFGWSEASWDHRAFTVLEDAVSATAANGTPETGLVLLPFSGWDEDEYRSGVQMFTFSSTTLTARAVMEHGAPVRRSFLTEGQRCANLSEIDLALHDVADPDAPVARGRVELAPSYSDLLVFGAYAARVASPTDYWWYGGWREELPDWSVQVVPLSEDPDRATPVAEFPIPIGADLMRLGELLVVAATEYDWQESEGGYTTRIGIWDMSDPTHPTRAGELTTTALEPWWDWWLGAEVDAAAAVGAPASDAAPWGGWYGYTRLRAHVVGEAIVFVSMRWESEPAGTREVCWTWPEGVEGGGADPGEPQPGGVTLPGADVIGGVDDIPTPDEGERDGESYYIGGIECIRENGGDPMCSGQIYRCVEGGECVLIDPGEAPTQTRCEEHAFERWWKRHALHALDLRDPAAPTLHAPVELPQGEDGVTTLTDGTSVLYNTVVPWAIEGDSRPYVRYYVRRVDFADPAAPVVGAAINVPGVLLAARGGDLYTQDFMYDGDFVESALSRVELRQDHAVLRARHRFPAREIDAMLLDGDGHALVSHRASWRAAGDWGWEETVRSRLTVLDDTNLVERSTLDVERWATLRAAFASRALFAVPGGLLVMNLDDPSAPRAQAYYPTGVWPRDIERAGDEVFMAAGRYGVFRVDLDAQNLLTAP